MVQSVGPANSTSDWLYIYLLRGCQPISAEISPYSVLHKKLERSPQKTCLFSFVLSLKQPTSGCHCHNRRSEFIFHDSTSRLFHCDFCSPLMMPVLWLTHRSVFVLLMLSPFNVFDFGRTLQSYSIVAHLDPPGGRRFNPSILSRRVCARVRMVGGWNSHSQNYKGEPALCRIP
jgi:hypothetical protein